MINIFFRRFIIFLKLIKNIYLILHRKSQPDIFHFVNKVITPIETKMQTNLNVRNISLKKVLLSTALTFGALTLAQANSTKNQIKEELNFKIEISDLKELPSITLVDKNLRVVAEFYGDPAAVKDQFDVTFQSAELLSKHNNRSIYLAVSK